jgi:tRNA(Arg) A34 adenosine deaminase TadA
MDSRDHRAGVLLGDFLDDLGGHSLRVWSTLARLALDFAGAGNARVAAAVVRRQSILGLGYNRMKSHPFQRRFGRNGDAIYWHAETDAIHNAYKSAPSDIVGATVYVLRLKRPASASKAWVLGNACPCSGCQDAINLFNIRRTIYTTEEGIQYG